MTSNDVTGNELTANGPVQKVRQLYMVLSPHAIPYASLTMQSLLKHSVEPVDLHLITDTASDKQALVDVVAPLQAETNHHWSVFSEQDLDDAEADHFAGFPNLRAFRHGHPCWRKITDPMLMSSPGEELILLDPDLYFPNRFRFEDTPADGLLLMWQNPNCLFPPEIVRRALDAGVPVARHVDIGVSHWRAQVDLEWLDWLIGRLGDGAKLPRVMHIEAIVWAAVAMRLGGGYLDPKLWSCWHRTQAKRLKRKLGIKGSRILRSEDWEHMKCFHAGGEAKLWIPEASETGVLPQAGVALQDGNVQPYIELTRAQYESEQSAKGLLRNLGYYRVFGARHA